MEDRKIDFPHPVHTGLSDNENDWGVHESEVVSMSSGPCILQLDDEEKLEEAQKGVCDRRTLVLLLLI